MRCKKCKDKKSVIYLPQYKLSLCSDCYIQWFLKRTEEVIKKFNMFTKNDKILIAVSGGKDSLSLWHSLIALGYNVDGFYINLGIGEYSEKSSHKALMFSERMNKKIYIKSVVDEIGKTIPEIRDLRSKCSTCGLIKRYFINRYAIENGYNVLATGHNLDDEVSSLLSTVLRWEVGYLARQYPVLEEKKGFVKKVKPFCFFSEKEDLIYAILNKIDFIEDECPYSVNATSIVYKKVLNEVENRSPSAKLRFFTEFLKRRLIFKEFKDFQKLNECRLCGQPTTGEICAFCKQFNKYLKKTESKN